MIVCTSIWKTTQDILLSITRVCSLDAHNEENFTASNTSGSTLGNGEYYGVCHATNAIKSNIHM